MKRSQKKRLEPWDSCIGNDLGERFGDHDGRKFLLVQNIPGPILEDMNVAAHVVRWKLGIKGSCGCELDATLNRVSTMHVGERFGLKRKIVLTTDQKLKTYGSMPRKKPNIFKNIEKKPWLDEMLEEFDEEIANAEKVKLEEPTPFVVRKAVPGAVPKPVSRNFSDIFYSGWK